MAIETSNAPKKTAQQLPRRGVKMNLKKTIGLSVLALGLALGAASVPQYLKASDHDDGETELKGRNLNLTDLFVFREQDQNPGAAAGDLVFVMNTNPRSLPRQQYYFSNRARYEFKVTRVTANNATPTGVPDMVLRFEFSAPDTNTQTQNYQMTALGADGSVIGTATGTTTPLTNASTPNISTANIGGQNLAVYAGLREDPFFFDVQQYFRVRGGARGIGPAVGFRPPEAAEDFAKGYNVNAIAVRVPRAFLQQGTSATTFDVWETISIGAGNTFNQVERLARPAINEGLVVKNENLIALNTVGPDFEAAALAGQQPAAGTAGPIIADAKATLLAFGNSDTTANALLQAFLPDVMRIDTTQPSTYDVDIVNNPNCLNVIPNSGRAAGAIPVATPICGRKIGDDVIDLTLKVVTGNPQASDNVSYPGNNPVVQGHQPLQPSFPYLALPN
jgi:hypothetical protein